MRIKRSHIAAACPWGTLTYRCSTNHISLMISPSFPVPVPVPVPFPFPVRARFCAQVQVPIIIIIVST